MNLLNLEQIKKIYEMTTPRWVSSEELHNMGSQLRLAYISGIDNFGYNIPDNVPVSEMRYFLKIKNRRTYESGEVEYLVEFVDW